MGIVVSDTSPIRALGHLHLLRVLGPLFGSVLVPPAVVRELSAPVVGVAPLDLAAFAFIRTQAPTDASIAKRVRQCSPPLDAGESEAIALALELKIGTVLIDEAAGRDAASRLGLIPVGVLGVLIRAKKRGLIPKVGPLLDQMVNELAFRVSAELRRTVLDLAGE